MFRIHRFFNLALVIATGCIITLFVANAAGQQQNTAEAKELEYVIGYDLRSLLFRDTDATMTEARKVQADVLAPKNFDKGMKSYQEASRDMKQGKKLEDIKEKLHEANAFSRLPLRRRDWPK